MKTSAELIPGKLERDNRVSVLLLPGPMSKPWSRRKKSVALQWRIVIKQLTASCPSTQQRQLVWHC